MNILFITEDHSTENYGVTTMLSQLADGLAQKRDDFTVIIAATGTSAVPQDEKVKVELIPPARGARGWRWSPDLLNGLRKIVDRYDVDLIHIHGVWSAVAWSGLRAAREMRIPTVVTVHGMWEGWFWKHDSPVRIFKKRLYFNWIFKRSLLPNTIMHAINLTEQEDIQRLLPHQSIAVIPNAVRIDGDLPISVAPEKMILFLGRLHPKKGVELLIRALARARLGPEWRLVIAGPEESPPYVRMLKDEVVKAGLSSQVTFIGPVFGDAKTELIPRAWVQVLPTYSEGQAMVNLETALCGVPSITTPQAGLSDWQAGGGLLIDPDAGALADSLLEVCNWSLEERNRRGERLRQWVIEHYSLEALLPRWEKLYRTLESGGSL